MKTIRIAAAIAAALQSMCAMAQDVTTTPQPSQDPAQSSAITSFGGSTTGSGGAGSPVGLTRQQVYELLLQSQRNGESQRMLEFYKGS